MQAMRDIDLGKLNSMTKYPSIPTYHAIERGVLQDTVVKFDGPVILTEKIDGTNARIILLPDGDYILGSREELLYARGDLVGNPAMGIVEHLRPIAERLPFESSGIAIIYGELYGGKVTAASKQYSSDQSVGFRVFDIAWIGEAKVESLMACDRSQIAAWRDSGGQSFYTEHHLTDVCELLDLATTPRLGVIDALPTSISETYELLKNALSSTQAALDGGAGQRPEGIVVRTSGRQRIAKLRFEDYEKTLRRK